MRTPMWKASKFGPALIAMIVAVALAVLALGIAFEPSARAQTSPGPARPMITQSIVEANLVRLFGNVRPEATAANDRGRVPDNLSMEHMLLQLKRPPAQEQALNQLIDQLHDPASPNFHRWLSPNQFGAQFGPAASDIQQVTGWLQRHGFGVNVVYPSGMTIDFSGNAGQVLAAFHTEIHYLQARGATHFANMSDPQIPAALASAVVGIVSLQRFHAAAAVVRKPKADYSVGSGNYLVTPADLATIYNFNPLFNAGMSGQNQTIYLIEDTDLYSTSDWTTFRSTFGLSGYTGASLSTVHPAPPSGTQQLHRSRGERLTTAKRSWMPNMPAPPRPAPRSSWPPAEQLHHLRRADRDTEPDQRGKPARHHQPELRRMRGVQRRLRQCGLQRDLSSRASRRGPRSSWPRAMKMRADAISGTGRDARHRRECLCLHPLQCRRRRHRFQRHLFRDQQHLLEFRQHRDLWLGQILHPGNSVEQFLRQPAPRDLPEATPPPMARPASATAATGETTS